MQRLAEGSGKYLIVAPMVTFKHENKPRERTHVDLGDGLVEDRRGQGAEAVNGGALVEAHPVDRALNAEMKRLWNSQPYNT